MEYCLDCGCKMYNEVCTNCHEEIYIEEQYYELGEVVPESICDKANEHRKIIYRLKEE